MELTAGSKQMWVVDRKQKIYLEWSKIVSPAILYLFLLSVGQENRQLGHLAGQVFDRSVIELVNLTSSTQVLLEKQSYKYTLNRYSNDIHNPLTGHLINRG